MNWYIIRHAAKEKGDFYNPVLRHQDQPISEQGRAEARNLSAYFTGKSIAAIYVSEYGRTRQTIEHAAQNLNLSPIVDPRLNEIDNGIIEGLTDQQIGQQFPEMWAAFMSRDRDFRFPQGESGADAQQRIHSFFAEKQKNPEDMILVSHDGWIRLLMCYILGLPVYRRWDFRVNTGGIMEIAYQPDFERWQLIRFNHKLPG